MRISRLAIASAMAAALAVSAFAARAETKVTIGRVVGGTGLHFPTYVAMERGFYKKEGLDAHWVTLGGKGLMTSGLAGQIDFVPITTGGVLAILHGAPLVYVVGLSMGSQWVIVTDKSIAKPEDLRGKTLAYGQIGGADYDEGASVLSRFFHMDPGRDYKVISFQSQPAELAALVNGAVQGALLQVPRAIKAEKAGFKVLLTTADYIPRLGGPTWVRKSFLDEHPDAVKAFDRAIAEAIMYIRTDKQGTMEIIKSYLGVDDPGEQALLWDRLHDTYDPRLPPKLFHDIFVQRQIDMERSGQWPKNRKLPDTEQYVARKLLDEALAEVHYVPPPQAKAAHN
jgi:ABC-type nitrate/sulfonate/bicarbonate transport system substrate-binding protein